MSVDEKVMWIILTVCITAAIWVIAPLFKRRKTVPRFIEPKPEMMYVKTIPRTDKIRTILGTRKVIIGYDYVIRRVGDE